jgi:hypothetical protein
MSARDVIAAKLALWGYDESMSDGLLAALTAAGFSIVHKDEIHAPSVERDEDRDLRAATAALIALSKHNIPTDVQELLVRGDPMRGIPPGALSASWAAALRELMKEVGR